MSISFAIYRDIDPDIHKGIDIDIDLDIAHTVA